MAVGDILLFFLLFDLNIISESFVKLTGPAYVFTNEQFWIYCESMIISQEQTAEFVIGDKTIDTLRYFNGSCFSTLDEGICNQARCRCFGGGTSYNLRMVAQADAGKINIGCSMKIHVDGKAIFINDTLAINVKDSLNTDISTKTTQNIPILFFTNVSTKQTKSVDASTTWHQTIVLSDGNGQLNGTITSIIVVGMILIVITSTFAGCFCSNRLRCARKEKRELPRVSSVTHSSYTGNLNEDPHYHSINDYDLNDRADRVPAFTSSVVEIVRRPRSNTESDVLYFEVLPDIEYGNSYESLCHDERENDYHHYLSCPMLKEQNQENIFLVSFHDMLSQEQHATRKINNIMNNHQFKRRTV